jgi:hypothetical protein
MHWQQTQVGRAVRAAGQHPRPAATAAGQQHSPRCRHRSRALPPLRAQSGCYSPCTGQLYSKQASPKKKTEQRQALGVVGGLLAPHLALLQGADTQNTEHGVATSALCERGSGAPRRRALRGPCCKSPPPGKKKTQQHFHCLSNGALSCLRSRVSAMFIFCTGTAQHQTPGLSPAALDSRAEPSREPHTAYK